MTRRTCVQIVLMASVVLGSTRHGHAQPPATRSTQAAAEEATCLDALVEQLLGEGKIMEAIPLAEQSFALWQRARGPHHLYAGDSLANLAALYQAQGADAQAEPLLSRVPDLCEQALDTIRLVARPHFARPCYWTSCTPAEDWAPLDPQLFQPAGHAP